MYFHKVGPGWDPVMPAKPIAVTPRTRRLEACQFAQLGILPVSTDQPAARNNAAFHQQTFRRQTSYAAAPMQQNPAFGGAIHHPLMQDRTPNAASAVRPSGIMPSPQALSMGGCAQSTTATSKPACRAAIAAASPDGPPPATRTSASRRLLMFTSAVRRAPNRIPDPSPRECYNCRQRGGAGS